MSLRKRHHRRVMNRIAQKCSGHGRRGEVCGRCVFSNFNRIRPSTWRALGWVPVLTRDALVFRGLK